MKWYKVNNNNKTYFIIAMVAIVMAPVLTSIVIIQALPKRDFGDEDSTLNLVDLKN